jgi:hypothetical protein
MESAAKMQKFIGKDVTIDMSKPMRNVIMFFASCGHVEIREVSDKEWLKYVTEPGHGPLGTSPPCRFKIGKKTRIVYVYPLRYSCCYECFKATEEEWFGKPTSQD